MRLGKAYIRNFGPYKELEFDFSNQGLCLIAGPTKAGKSTVMDIACWLLYGITSKDSAADDMRSWSADGPTEGWIEVSGTREDESIIVHRIRGKASENDLYYINPRAHHAQFRGKDLKDTQKLLEERLGVSAELYIIGSYMHQFSNADTFFVAKAKDRREVLEKLADLSLPIKLGTRASECRKEKKKELEQLGQALSKLEGKLEQTDKTRAAALVGHERYEVERALKLENLEDRAQNFETIRQNNVHTMVSKIEELSKIVVDPDQIVGRMNQIKVQIKSLEQAKKEHIQQSKKFWELNRELEDAHEKRRSHEHLLEEKLCPTCHGYTEGNDNLKGMAKEINSYIMDLEPAVVAQRKVVDALEQAISIENKIHAAYDKCRQDESSNERMIKELEELRAKTIAARGETNRYYEDITTLKADTNPYEAQIIVCDKTIVELQSDIDEITQLTKDTEHLIANLNWLYDKSFELRATMLERAKNELANKTNEYLEKFFDAELRIQLTFEGSDKLNVDIMNEGYPCPYKQLSGGERCMLKLAFNLSLMKRAEDVAGVKFSTIMLDEALNGLDASLKSKAYNLLQTLENDYETVLLIDHHEEFKNLFTNQYHVVKESGYSVLTHEE